MKKKPEIGFFWKFVLGGRQEFLKLDGVQSGKFIC